MFDLGIKIEKDGKTIVERPSHSYVKNFYIFLFAQGACIVANSSTNQSFFLINTSGSDVQGNSFYVCALFNNAGIYGSLGNDNIGIVVGSSDTTENWSDYNLSSKITHGVNPGQLVYNLMSNPGYSGEKILAHARSFTNNGVSNVTVKEIGYIRTLAYPTSNILMARDVLDSPITISPGENINVSYIFSLTYPSS